MIVRISGEGQFRLADSDAARLNELEGPVIAAVEEGRHDDYPAAFAALLDYVRRGEQLPDEELAASQVILPPSDTTFEEAGREFTGEGLIPD